MGKMKKFMKSPAFTVVLFVIAAGLLAASTIGGARAALSYSAEYRSQLELNDIGVTLTEGGEAVSNRDYKTDSNDEWDDSGEGVLLTGLLAKDEEGKEESFVPGRVYEEKIGVVNTGTIPEYVRVVITKYWTDKDGKKLTKLSPDEIELIIPEGNGWVKDEKASSSPERDVYYYTKILNAGDPATLSESLRVDSDILRGVTVTENKSEDGRYTEYIMTYDYDGTKFNIEAKADAVQTHNAAHAIKSAWGRDVTINGSGTLSLD